jgi:hypothetical protein
MGTSTTIWDAELGSVVELGFSIAPHHGRLTNTVRILRRVGTTELRDGREHTTLTVDVIGVDADGRDLDWDGHTTVQGSAPIEVVTTPA